MNNEDRSHKSAEGKIGTQVGDRKEKNILKEMLIPRRSRKVCLKVTGRPR